MKEEDKIKTLDRYFLLKKLFLKYGCGTSKFFIKEMRISRRSFHRYLKYMKHEDKMNITYNNVRKMYVLDDIE